MKYTQSPLPFVGQKRNFLKHFQQVLKENINNDGENWTILDAFGGSGLLSHTAKQALPKARVIYNDFDDHSERLKHIDDINRLRRAILNVLEREQIAKQSKLPESIKFEIIQIIQSFDGYKDLHCIANWLMFSGRQVYNFDKLFSETWYYQIRESDYPSAENYLKDVEIIRENANSLIPKFTNNHQTLLVLDPPYVCTAQGSYLQDEYFGMVQFLRLMSVVRPPFVFFSSTRSEFIDYLDFMIETRQAGWERFANYQKISIRTSLNKTTKYEDNLVFKF